MFKKLILLFVVLGLPSLSIAQNWTGHYKIKKLYPHGDSKGIYVQLESASINPDNCGNTDWYFLGPDNSMQKEIYSLLLAAKKSQSPVTMYIQGCAQGRPAIMAAIEE